MTLPSLMISKLRQHLRDEECVRQSMLTYISTANTQCSPQFLQDLCVATFTIDEGEHEGHVL